MRAPKLSTLCCAIPVRVMLAAIPYSRGQSNSSPPTKRKSVNAAAPRIPNSSRKNTPLPCGISSMPSSASTHSIHAGSWKSPSRSPACGESFSRRHKDTEKSSCPPRCRRPLRHVFSFQHFSISAFSFVPHVCRIQTHRSRARHRHGFERALDYCTRFV